jgi:hypothetical protein
MPQILNDLAQAIKAIGVIASAAAWVWFWLGSATRKYHIKKKMQRLSTIPAKAHKPEWLIRRSLPSLGLSVVYSAWFAWRRDSPSGLDVMLLVWIVAGAVATVLLDVVSGLFIRATLEIEESREM